MMNDKVGKMVGRLVTALPEELQGKCTIDCETIRGRCGEYLGIRVESNVI
jgi:hypothetical protein